MAELEVRLFEALLGHGVGGRRRAAQLRGDLPVAGALLQQLEDLAVALELLEASLRDAEPLPLTVLALAREALGLRFALRLGGLVRHVCSGPMDRYRLSRSPS